MRWETKKEETKMKLMEQMQMLKWTEINFECFMDENQNDVKEPELRIISYSGPDPPSETDGTVWDFIL